MKHAYYLLILLIALSLTGCSGSDQSSSACPLPEPFCGDSFELNLQQTTDYGPAWADIVTSSEDWITCFGPYALCYYANCTPSPGSDGTVAECSCFEAFGINFVDINAILNDDVYTETKAYCTANPDACKEPNKAPVCASLMSGEFMAGASTFSTFSFYRSTVEPIGLTDCADQPALYAGCMTAPCFGESTPGEDPNTTMITCQCPTYDGPFQVGSNDLSCDDGASIYSAAYSIGTPVPPSSKCDIIGDRCLPDASEENCGCPLIVPGTTSLPSDTNIDCTLVCEQYNTCQNSDGVQLGYTCDATLCTSENKTLITDACSGLETCDVSEIFKAEIAAGCSCCGSQLCNCEANATTETQIEILVEQQRNAGETPQCDVNGTLCGQ